MDLRKYYTLGFPILQTMLIIGSLGIVISLVYYFCSGGTAG